MTALKFRSGERQLRIAMDHLEEIVARCHRTALPAPILREAHQVRAMTEWRGAIIPVVRLAGPAASNSGDEKYLLVMQGCRGAFALECQELLGVGPVSGPDQCCGPEEQIVSPSRLDPNAAPEGAR